MKDTLQETVNQIRTTLSGLKSKSSRIKTVVGELDSKIERLDLKLDELVNETEIYKTGLEWETGREVRRLEIALEKMKADLKLNTKNDHKSDNTELRIATSVSIFETIIEHICESSEDYKLMCYSVVFPLVYERVNRAVSNYLIDEMPSVSDQVIAIGRQELANIRKDCDIRLTDPDAWDYYKDRVFRWWVDYGLTLILEGQDKSWETDQPYSLLEMLKWRDELNSRPIMFSKVYDVYEIYKKHRRDVYVDAGIRDFEVEFLGIQQLSQSDEEEENDEIDEEDTWIPGKSMSLRDNEL